MLFDEPIEFTGLPVEGFEVFRIPDRRERRDAIIATFHGPLQKLANDLLPGLELAAGCKLYAHLPRLNWPANYEPFATWLAITRDPHGYQAHAQLNLGVHMDYVAIRLGWDVQQDAFGRFEFLCRYGRRGAELVELAREHDLRFRVYAADAWPRGSRCVFESGHDHARAFDVCRQTGVWFELGRRYDLEANASLIGSREIGVEAAHLFELLLPHTAHT